MRKKEIMLGFEVYDSSKELAGPDESLVNAAREITGKAYAPYSNFMVGAIARFTNGETAAGTNQENASYPVGICAERALLSLAAMTHTNIPIDTIAIAYHNLNGESDRPVSPCGMCRQYISEYEERMKHPIRLILTGMSGNVYIIKSAGELLPLSFGGNDLK